jgi:hypothetical protein
MLLNFARPAFLVKRQPPAPADALDQAAASAETAVVVRASSRQVMAAYRPWGAMAQGFFVFLTLVALVPF